MEDNLTFAVMITLVGMGGTLLSLALIALFIKFITLALPVVEKKSHEK